MSLANFPKLVHPSNIIISGPTKSGKTELLVRLIKNKMFEPMPTRVIYVYSHWQEAYDRLKQEMPRIEFVEGPVTQELYDSIKPSVQNMIVLDDQMTRTAMAGKTAEMVLARFFTEGSHHLNLTVVYLIQNLFDQNSKALRTASLNSQYLFLFKSIRDQNQVQYLARQMCRNMQAQKAMVAAFDHATRKPYRYLLVDLDTETPKEFRLRAKVVPGESWAPTVYAAV